MTSRQAEICQLLAESHTTKAIALMLNVSEKDIEYHRLELVKKLGIPKRNVALITRAAVEMGLIKL